MEYFPAFELNDQWLCAMNLVQRASMELTAFVMKRGGEYSCATWDNHSLIVNFFDKIELEKHGKFWTMIIWKGRY